MQTVNATFLTSGDIAQALGRSVFQVRYVLDSRPDIQPLARAGLVRLYSGEVVEHVRAELAAIAAKRAKARCA
ncbi:MAG: hypothetical protein IH983_12050 [Planctomycetes bacterium]|nr:hypothetical protein [Planctomycetota bacterium]